MALPFPLTPILDDFNRANEDPLGTSSSGITWTGGLSGGGSAFLRITSNECLPDTAGDYNHAYLNRDFNADCEVYCTIAAQAGTTGAETGALYCRLINAGTTSCKGYELEFDHFVSGDELTVYRMDSSSTFVSLGSFPRGGGQLGVGDAIGMRVTGWWDVVTCEVFVKPSGGSWGSVGSVRDTSANRVVSGGKIALELYTSSSHADDLGGGSIPYPTVQYTPDGDQAPFLPWQRALIH